MPAFGRPTIATRSGFSGLSHAEGPRIERPRLAGGAFRLVGDDDHRLAAGAQDIRETLIEGRHARAGVDDEEARRSLRYGAIGLQAHAAFERLFRRLFEAGRIHNREFEVAETRVAFAPVARNARRIINKRQTLADKPVEQRRLADIRTADNGDLSHAASGPAQPIT